MILELEDSLDTASNSGIVIGAMSNKPNLEKSDGLTEMPRATGKGGSLDMASASLLSRLLFVG